MKESVSNKTIKAVKKTWIDLVELRALIDLVKETDVSELEVEKAGMRIKIKKPSPSASYGLKRYQDTVSATTSSAPSNYSSHIHTSEISDDKYYAVTSPIVGTFYRSSTPGSDSYVNVGDIVKKGQTLCIVEAMKLMNEIESEIDGKVVEVLAEDSQPVEYGEVLFKLEPTS